MLKKIGLAAGAAALISTPIALQAQISDRAAAPVAGEQSLGGGSDTILAVLAGAILVTFVVITATDDDEPVSP